LVAFSLMRGMESSQMKYFSATDHVINLDQIAYVERQAANPLVVTVYFSAVATAPGGEPQPLSLILRGTDAQNLIKTLDPKFPL